MKGKAPRKHSLHEKTAASVIVAAVIIAVRVAAYNVLSEKYFFLNRQLH